MGLTRSQRAVFCVVNRVQRTKDLMAILNLNWFQRSGSGVSSRVFCIYWQVCIPNVQRLIALGIIMPEILGKLGRKVYLRLLHQSSKFLYNYFTYYQNIKENYILHLISSIHRSMKHPFFILILILALTLSCHTFSLNQDPSSGIDLKASSYNTSTSRDYAILAVTSYCDKKCIENWNCQITNNYLKSDKIINITHVMGTITRAAGFVAYDQTKNLIVVSLRGSANIENWIEDFTFDSVPFSKCKGCRVHNGFMADYDSIQSKIHEAVDNLVKAYPTAEILATGHSMGAALSVIFGVELKLKHSNVIVEIQNLGCPRVGNPSFAQFVQTKVDRLNRLVHNRDLIPHLPPLEKGYHHAAYEIFYDEPFENFTICSESGQDKNCSNKFFPDYSFGDHGFYFYDFNKIFKC